MTEATPEKEKALEHEIDHLDGRLYIDHVASRERLHMVEHTAELERGTIAFGHQGGGDSSEMRPATVVSSRGR